MTSLRLIHRKSERVLFEWTDGRSTFHDVFLGRVLKELGIFIPPIFREEFGGKSFVKADDLQFFKAFNELYFPREFDQDEFYCVSDNVSI